MTRDNYTDWETRRYHALFTRQLRESLPPDELAELRRLERRHEAEQFCKGVYAAAVYDLNLEHSLAGVEEGLIRQMHARDASERVEGLKTALQAVLDEPDALMAAVRGLLRNLEAAAD